ncbi:hypothetical protein AMTR_s02893p00002320, partial [Amborella trichopoda]
MSLYDEEEERMEDLAGSTHWEEDRTEGLDPFNYALWFLLCLEINARWGWIPFNSLHGPKVAVISAFSSLQTSIIKFSLEGPKERAGYRAAASVGKAANTAVQSPPGSRRLYCSPTTPFSRFRLLPFRSLAVVRNRLPNSKKRRHFSKIRARNESIKVFPPSFNDEGASQFPLLRTSNDRAGGEAEGAV